MANLKTASTSIESQLKRCGDIVVMESPLGKHLPYSEIIKRFRWIFEVYPESSFFKFAVIRDPVDYMLSLYRSHCHEKFMRDDRLYTGNMNFKDFLDVWTINNPGQVMPQSRRFRDENGEYRLDFLARYESLESDLGMVCDRLGIERLVLPRLNVSPVFKIDVSMYEKGRIIDIFKEDYEVIERLLVTQNEPIIDGQSKQIR